MPLGKTEPPFSDAARRDAGFLLRMLQRGESLRMPRSRPMPTIGRRCHELRINGQNQTWRIVCTDWIPMRGRDRGSDDTMNSVSEGEHEEREA